MDLVKLHLAVLTVTAFVVLYADREAYLYLRGKKQTLDPKTMMLVHRLMWAGLLGMIATGAAMALPAIGVLIKEPVFLLKMGFVATLVGNAFAIGKFGKVATERPFAALTIKESRTLMVMGMLSWVGWLGAATIGYFYL